LTSAALRCGGFSLCGLLERQKAKSPGANRGFNRCILDAGSIRTDQAPYSLFKNCCWSDENGDFENRSAAYLKYVSTGSTEIAICRRPTAIIG